MTKKENPLTALAAKALSDQSKSFSQEFIQEMEVLHIKKGDLVYIRPKEPLGESDLAQVRKSLASIQKLVGIQIWYDNLGSFNLSIMRKEPTDGKGKPIREETEAGS